MKQLTEVEYKDKTYSFSWYSVGLFFMLCPLVSISLYLIFQHFWEYTYPPFVQPVSSVLSWITGEDFSFYQGPKKYYISVPGRIDVGFNAACAGIYAYAIYLGICLATPHNKHHDQNKSVWVRKTKTWIVACLAVFFYNVFRVVLTVIMYYNGVPFNPMHENISYTLTFFSVFVFYLISYFWLPEFSLFVIWMKDDVKCSIAKLRARDGPPEEKTSKKKMAKKALVIGTWIVICVFLFVILSVLLV